MTGLFTIFPERRERDQRRTEWLEDLGYTAVRFARDDEWESPLQSYPRVFGAGQRCQAAPPANVKAFDPDLFDGKCRELLAALSTAIVGVAIEPGGDMIHDGRVVGRYFAELVSADLKLRLIDAGEASVEQIKTTIINEGCAAVVVDHRQWREAARTIIQNVLEDRSLSTLLTASRF